MIWNRSLNRRKGKIVRRPDRQQRRLEVFEPRLVMSGMGVVLAESSLQELITDATFGDPAAPPDIHPPVISPIGNQTAYEDQGVGSFSFRVSDSDTLPDLLSLVATSSNHSLIPPDKLMLEGSGGFYSVTLNTLPNSYGNSRIVIEASDGVHVTQMAFDVTVLPVNDPPVTVGIPHYRVNAASRQLIVDLSQAFTDVEDGARGLTYSIRANSNPGLFESVVADDVADRLVLRYSNEASGSADFTIVATDSAGASVSLNSSETDVDVYTFVYPESLIPNSLGVKPMNLWTSWTMFDLVDGVYQYDRFNEGTFREKLNDTSLSRRDSPIVLNIEHELYENTRAGRERLAHIFKIANEVQPDVDLGVYRLLPETNYWDPVRWYQVLADRERNIPSWFVRNANELEQGYRQYEWRNSLFRTQPVDSSGKSLAEYLDVINPSLYTSYRNSAHDAERIFYDLSIDTANDSFTLINGESFSTISRIVLIAEEGGQLPLNVSPWREYYVINAAGNRFQIADTPGGAPMDLTDTFRGKLFAAPEGPWDDVRMDPDYTGWKYFAQASIVEARKYGKPVYAWISPSMFGAGGEILEKDYFRLQLDTLAGITDGIVIFEASQETPILNSSQGWYQALTEFLNEHRLTMPTFRVTIDPAEITQPPVAGNDTFLMAEDTTLTITSAMLLANDSANSSKPLGVVLVSAPEHGQITENGDGTWSYTPHKDYFGQDVFGYRVTDGLRNSDTARVTINVASVPDAAPVARTDHYSTMFGQPLEVVTNHVLSNDSDDDSEFLWAVLVTPPRYGSLHLDDTGIFSYIPKPGFSGEDRFVYRAMDPTGLSGQAEVIIMVGPQGNSGGGIGGDGSQEGDLSDGNVTSQDLLVFLANWTGALPAGTGGRLKRHGDFDGDADVDSVDMLELIDLWQSTSGTQATPPVSGTTPAAGPSPRRPTTSRPEAVDDVFGSETPRDGDLDDSVNAILWIT